MNISTYIYIHVHLHLEVHLHVQWYSHSHTFTLHLHLHSFTLCLHYLYSTITVHLHCITLKYIQITFALQYIHLNSYTIYKHWITLDCITLLYKITPITHITQYINIHNIYIHTIQIDTDSHMFHICSLTYPFAFWAQKKCGRHWLHQSLSSKISSLISNTSRMPLRVGSISWLNRLDDLWDSEERISWCCMIIKQDLQIAQGCN